MVEEMQEKDFESNLFMKVPFFTVDQGRPTFGLIRKFKFSIDMSWSLNYGDFGLISLEIMF